MVIERSNWALNIELVIILMHCFLLFLVAGGCVSMARITKFQAQVSNGEFSNAGTNDFWRGGAIMFDGGGQETTVSHCTFRNCYNRESDVTEENVVLGGGAIYVKGVKLTCKDTCTFEDCKAKIGRGGAILADTGSEVSLNTCQFTRCKTTNSGKGQEIRGGAIFVTDKKLTAVQTTFTECSTPQLSGGQGIYVTGAGGAIQSDDLECRECTFTKCVSTASGGAISLYEGGKPLSLTLEQCKFLECEGRNTRSAALLYEGDGVVIIKNCDIKGCISSGSWDTGTLTIRGKSKANAEPLTKFSVTVEGCTFEENTQEPGRGAISLAALQIIFLDKEGTYDYSKLSIRSCKFIGQKEGCPLVLLRSLTNWAEDFHPIQKLFTLEGCNFTDNTFQSQDEVLDISSSVGIILKDCTFQNNKLTSGSCGTMRFYNGDYTFQNCRFIGWQATTPVLSIPESVTIGTVELSNCVFQDCTTGIFGALTCTKATVDNCDFTGCQGSTATVELHCPELAFTNNDFVFNLNSASEYGLILEVTNVDSQFLLDNCHFSNNGNENFGQGLLKINENQKKVKFTQCSFTGALSSKSTGVCLTLGGEVMLSNCKFTNVDSENTICHVDGTDVTIESCTFTGCSSTGTSTGASVLSSTAAAEHAFTILTAACNKLSMSKCTFSQCTSQSGNIFKLDAQEYSFVENEVSSDCQTQEKSPMWFILREKGINLADMLFHVRAPSQVKSALVQITYEAAGVANFVNCCFTHELQGAEPEYKAPLYLNFVGTGSAAFKTVCFDTEKEVAISSGASISYDLEEKYYFAGKCQCWIDPTPEPPSKPVESDTDEPVESDTDEPMESTTKEDEGNAGAPKGTNIGLVVGLLLLFLLLLLLVLLILLIFYRRRRTLKNTSEEEEEVPEETLTTQSEDMGISADTADVNPLWATEEPLREFAKEFEEHLMSNFLTS